MTAAAQTENVVKPRDVAEVVKTVDLPRLDVPEMTPQQHLSLRIMAEVALFAAVFVAVKVGVVSLPQVADCITTAKHWAEGNPDAMSMLNGGIALAIGRWMRRHHA